MDQAKVKAVNAAARNHPRSTTAASLGYGTAGFRKRASDLDHVLYRVGLLAVLRSKSRAGATIGAMITASHNPEQDNGVKVIDPHGEMLEMRWEKHAARLANVPDADIISCLESIVAMEEIDLGQPAHVAVAMDTRPSSPALRTALEHGVQALGGNLNNYGLLTTPQLHYMVRCINTNGDYGKPTREGYYRKITRGFIKLATERPVTGRYLPQVFVDAANGIGALALKSLQESLGDVLQITVANDGSEGKLNYMCGADFVKIQQKAPEGVDLHHNTRYASFDGDADRIVFYYKSKDSSFQLLDGDKIATLITGYLKELIVECDLDLDLGIVQTAYANGSSAKYITDTLQGVKLVCAATGVKHLHHEAVSMDVGVYFEANGHGTILFSDKATKLIQEGSDNDRLPSNQQTAFKALLALMDVTNQTVGDSISDLLLVELVLRSRGWDQEDWNKTYTDLPNRQLKVSVEDRNLIQTTDAERRASSPEGLQAEIDSTVSKYPCGRSFVRPSGTEDVVRVYAEAKTQEEADRLGHEVSLIVHKLCRGIGEPPAPPSPPGH